MKICPNCGTSNPENAQFCHKCGTSLESVHSTLGNSSTNGQGQRTSQQQHGFRWFIVLLIIVLFAGGGYWAYSAGLIDLTPKVGFRHESKKSTTSDEASKLEKENAKLKSQKGEASSSSSSAKSQESNQTVLNKAASLTTSQKTSIASAFTSWADQRANIGNMAVSDWYFDHGSAGSSDWTAMTTDGKVLVQNEDNPGPASYKLQAIGGVVFYKAKDRTTGLDTGLHSGSTADGYSTNMDFDQNVSKYLLANNGVVYELKLPAGSTVSPVTGFANSDGGGNGNYTFQRSQDEAAQSELKQLLSKYSDD